MDLIKNEVCVPAINITIGEAGIIGEAGATTNCDLSLRLSLYDKIAAASAPAVALQQCGFVTAQGLLSKPLPG